MKQAGRFERLLFDPFSLFQNGFVPAEEDVGGWDVVQALVAVLVVVVVDESFDLSFEVAGQEVIFQRNAVLEGLMSSLNPALRLGMIRCATRVLHAFVLQPVSQISSDESCAIIAEKTRLVDNMNPIAT